MGAAIPRAFLIVVRVCTAVSDIIAAAAHVIMLCHAGSWEIHRGGQPKNEWATNVSLYHNLLMVVAASALFFMAIIQILLCFHVPCLDFLRQRFIIPVLQIFLGILTLGAAGDLGIAGASLVMIFGLIGLIISFVGGGRN